MAVPGFGGPAEQSLMHAIQRKRQNPFHINRGGKGGPTATGGTRTPGGPAGGRPQVALQHLNYVALQQQQTQDLLSQIAARKGGPAGGKPVLTAAAHDSGGPSGSTVANYYLSHPGAARQARRRYVQREQYERRFHQFYQGHPRQQNA